MYVQLKAWARSESEYLQILQVLQSFFERPLRRMLCPPVTMRSRLRRWTGIDTRTPASTVLGWLFGDLEQLSRLHQLLHQDLLHIIQQGDTLEHGASAFQHHAAESVAMQLGQPLLKLSVYRNLLPKHVSGLRALENLYYVDVEFRAAIDQCEQASGRSLRELLLCVHQRVWYTLGMLQEIHRRWNMGGSLQFLLSLYRSMGPTIRQLEVTATLAQLQNSICELPEPLVIPGIDLLYHGTLLQCIDDHSGHRRRSNLGERYRGGMSEVLAWLLTDRLVIARMMPEGRVHDATYFIQSLQVEQQVWPRAICIHTKLGVVRLQAETERQSQVWWQAVSYAIQTLPSRSASSTDSSGISRRLM